MADVWDITTPAGSEAISNGDDRIREMKSAIQSALRGEVAEGTEAVFPGTAAATAPVFRYRGLKDITGNRPASGQYGLFFDTTRQSLQRDNGSTWDDIGTNIPAGTVMVFYQASVPTGWAAVTGNDKALRVVTNGTTGGSAGGSAAFSTAFAVGVTGDESGHTHALNGSTSVAAAGSSGGTTYVEGGTNHVHTIAFTSGAGAAHHHSTPQYQPAYSDVVFGTKS